MLRAARSRRVARPLVAGVGGLRRPLRVLLIALGLLVAQGPVLLHLLLVQHTTCEHGELVEVSRLSRAREAAASEEGATPRAARRAGGSDTVSTASAAASGHDHCDALAMRHRPTEVGLAVMSASLVWVEAIEVGGERAETRAVPLLALAPKGSPPVV